MESIGASPRTSASINQLMDADEIEDYLELRDPGVKRQIAVSRRDVSPLDALVRLALSWLSFSRSRNCARLRLARAPEHEREVPRFYNAGIRKKS